MKRIERYNLVDSIGRHLQSTMSTSNINVYLGGFGIEHPGEKICTSKWIYVKDILADESDQQVLRIAKDLEMELPTDLPQSAADFKDYLSQQGLVDCHDDFSSAL